MSQGGGRNINTQFYTENQHGNNTYHLASQLYPPAGQQPSSTAHTPPAVPNASEPTHPKAQTTSNENQTSIMRQESILTPQAQSLENTSPDIDTRQAALPSKGPSAQQTPHASTMSTGSHVLGATPAETSPPTYQIGVIRAKAAQEHLDEGMGAIKTLLRKARNYITPEKWTAQVGFMHEREEFESYITSGLYGRENQVILITVLDSKGIKEGEFTRLKDDLGRVIPSFYALLRWGKQAGVIQPNRRGNDQGGHSEQSIFQPACGASVKGDFRTSAAGATEVPEVRIETSNFGDNERHSSYMSIGCKIVKEDKPDGSQVIECRELSFKGPTQKEYELRHAYVLAVGAGFGDVRPHQRGELNSNAQWKQTGGVTEKEARTATIAGEASQGGGKLSAGLSRTTGEDRSSAWETTRNGLRISHRRDAATNSIKITYTPAHHSPVEELVVAEDDLPNITIPPESAGPQRGTVTIRTLSTWRLKAQAPPGSVKLWEKAGAYMPFSKEKKAPAYRRDVDVVFCCEISVALGALGSNKFSAFPDMRVSF